MHTTLGMGLFIQYFETQPVYYASIVVGMIISIVLHELAHGWAAISQGDRTPIELGHMTPNPVTHMGFMGLAAVFLIGIGWGRMFVDPSRFRSKYGDAIVSAAGPAMNLLLAIIGLTAFALWRKFGDVEPSETVKNFQFALYLFGYLNILLAIFNLGPVPPLDGSTILANFHRGYRRWLYDNAEHTQFFFLGYFVIIMALNRTPYGLFPISDTIAKWFVGLFGVHTNSLF